ncbi:MAG: helix-turn-helix transcriptional regulator [Crocinitomicaceae bacterium]|nr:helix-turn-helix transcriptional regulator [Crocinitomicaceae bacterium]
MQQETIKELISNEFELGKINHSKLRQFHKEVKDSPFSIKYVQSGKERYKLDHYNFEVSKGNYLIVNSEDEFTIDFESDEIADGICIYPSQELIHQAYQAKSQSLDQLLSGEKSSDSFHFTHMVNATSKTKTGKFLELHLPELINKLEKGESIDLNSFFLDLVDYMVIDQINLNQQLGNHSATKVATKEELYRRISAAKEFLTDNFKEKINLDEVAQLSCLSKFHFLRSFKEFYGQSPYQYLLSLKLEAAKNLRKSGFSFNEICLETGFSDPKNLRKALKKDGFCL